jgi:phosphonate transport system substrate-binding protein
MSLALFYRAWQNGVVKNKRRWSSCFFVGMFLCLALCVGACTKFESKQHIVIGVQPNEANKPLSVLQEALERRVGVGVQFFVPKDYEELIHRFRAGDVDFAFFSPLTFILAEESAGAKALLKKVYGKDEFYYSAILVLRSSKVKTLDQLKGKRFGFVDPKSTSGFLVPGSMLKRRGVFVNLENAEANEGGAKGEFFGTHQKALQALMENKVDAVGVWANAPGVGGGAWTRDVPNGEKLFRVLEISNPIPNDAFAVREAYYAKNHQVVFRVMEALIDLSSGGDQAVLKRVLDVDSMTTATSRHYDSVRELKSFVEGGSKP